MALEPKTLGQALTLALRQADMTQVQLAIKVGLSTTILNKLATDRPSQTPPDLAMIGKIEKALRLERGTLQSFVEIAP